jgi:hypothetical protein
VPVLGSNRRPFERGQQGPLRSVVLSRILSIGTACSFSREPSA